MTLSEFRTRWPGFALAAFVVASMSSAAAAGEGETRPDLICSGQEPPWTLAVHQDAARFITPSVEETPFTILDERPAEGRFWPRTVMLTSPSGIGTGIALIRPATCSDTMSDTTFDWAIDFLSRTSPTPVTLTGCCRVAPLE